MGGLFVLSGVFSSLSLVVPLLVVLGLLVILALRHEDDADGNRAPAIYGSMVWLVGLVTILVAVAGVATSLLSLADAESYEQDGAVSSGVLFLIVGLAAAGLLFAHRQLFV